MTVEPLSFEDLEFIANGLRDLADQQDAKFMNEGTEEDRAEMVALAERNRSLSERLFQGLKEAGYVITDR